MLRIERSVVTFTVDKKCRCSVHATSHSALEIFANPRRINARSDFPNHSRLVETEFGRVLREVLILKRPLIFEQKIMHAPKVSLRTGCFRSLGRVFRVRMDLRQWKVAEGEK